MLPHRRSDKVELIRNVPLFQSLSNKDLDLIAKHADEISEPEGKVLCKQGENARELIILVEGKARVERSGHTIDHMGPGEFIGEMGLIDGQPRSATVTLESPGTLLVIEARSFWTLLESVPGLSRKLLAALTDRIRHLHETYID